MGRYHRKTFISLRALRRVLNFKSEDSMVRHLLIFITLCLSLWLVTPASLTTAKDVKSDYDPWAWTRKNLNTGWMDWSEKYWPTQPVSGGVFRRASAAYVGLMNPNHWPVNDWSVIATIYEGLAAYDGKYIQRHTWLMESFKLTSPTTAIMKLKEGIQYHDGTDFNAHSLKYLFDWIGDKKNGCWTLGIQRDKKLEVVDEYTLKWIVDKPWGTFPVGFFGFQISEKALRGDVALRELKSANKKIKTLTKKLDKAKSKYKKTRGKSGEAKSLKKLKKAKKALDQAQNTVQKWADISRGHIKTDLNPVGTGAFMYHDASPGNYLKLKRNPNWWFGKTIGKPEMPYFEEIRITVIPDPAIRLANLRAGKIDTMGVSKAQYPLIKRDPNLTVHTSLNNFTVTLNFNMAKGPCQDLRVRKAIAHAIDRKALIAGTQFGLARMASCLYPEDHWAHNPDLKPVPYDPELAKKLLKEAGFEKGLKLAGINSNIQDAITLFTAIKNMLAKVGVEWKADILDSAAGMDRMRNLEYDLAMMGHPYIQDPDGPVNNFYHPSGAFHNGRNNNPKLTSLIEDARYTIDQKKRQQLYYQIEAEIYRNYMDIFLFWDIGAVAYRKNVQGWNNEMWVGYRTLYNNSHPLWFKNGKP